MKLLLIILSVFLVASAVSLAEDLNADLEQEAERIEGLLIAPCCWRQPVVDHFSPAADKVRSEIRSMLAAGSTREEILERYIAEYGQRILAKPPARGFSLLAYFLPLLFLIVGAAVAVAVVKKLRSPKEPDGKRISLAQVDPGCARWRSTWLMRDGA